MQKEYHVPEMKVVELQTEDIMGTSWMEPTNPPLDEENLGEWG